MIDQVTEHDVLPERLRAASEAIERAFMPLCASVPLKGAEWADRYFYLSGESSGTTGAWSCYPYQTAILNWMTSDDIEEINVQKSRRIGYTKSLMAAMACLIVQKNRNIAIWHPTDGDAKDFVNDEIDPLLRDVPVFGDRLKCKVGAKSPWNTTTKKGFYGATLDIKGGKSAGNFRRMTKDVAIYDETDGFDFDIEGEGNCFELGDGRLDQAPFPKSIRGSTPKTKGRSPIETAVEDSDAVFYRFVPCPHCGLLQRLEFANLKWDKGKPETTRYVCKNGCEIRYADYPAMDAAGRWQTLDGTYYVEEKDHFCDANDVVIPKPRRLAVKIWAAYSYLKSWSWLVDKWLVASRNAKKGNVTTLKVVINTLLGETFEEEGESVDSSTLTQRGEDYLLSGTIPNEVLVVTVGADVQGGANARVELEFVGHGLEDETWSLDYVVIPGEPERQEVWDHLDDQLLRRFTRVDGVSLRVAAAFIDSGYLATKVYQFTASRRKRYIFATKGVNTGTVCNAGTWQGEKKNQSRCILHTVNVDDAKTIIFNRLQISKHGSGFCHFPDHYPDRHFIQLTNEEKVEKRKRGVRVGYEWIQKGPNEQLDCRAYALGAFARLNANMPRLKLRLERQAEVIAAQQAASGKEQPPEASEHYTEKAAKKQTQRARGKKKSFVHGW